MGRVAAWGGALARWGALGALAALAVTLAALAQAPAPGGFDLRRIDAGAIDAARRMSATMAAAPSFTVRITTLREAVLPNGQVVLLSGTTGVAARRPDRLIATVGSDLGNFAVIYDGTQATVFEPTANVYARSPMTGPLADAVARIEDELGLAMPIRPLLAADPFALLMTPAPTEGVIVGRSFIGDTPVDHLAFRNAEADWEIWLEATPHALPRRVSFVRRVDDRPIRITLTFDEWALGATLPDAVFAFTPPAGATAVSPAPPEHRPQGAPRR
jgi:hypothetical protein